MPKTKVRGLYSDHKNADDIAKVLEMRSDDKSWSDIAEEVGIGQGKAMYLAMIGDVDDDTHIDSDSLTETQLAKAIVAAREKDKQSWGQIAARTLGKVGEGKVRTIYEATSGKSASDSEIGKGGRGASANGAAPKKAAAGKKAPAKKTPAPSAGKKLLTEMTLEDLQNRLDGVEILNAKGATLTVEKVTGLKNGTMQFVNGTSGRKETMKVTDIKKAKAKK